MSDFVYTVLTALTSLGYLGIALGLMIEIIPSEIVLAYGGFMVGKGTIGFTGAVVAGTVGIILAQLFLYWIGYYGGRPFIEKYGKYLLLHKKHVDKAESWFERYGAGVVFTARFIPVLRQAISIPAGIAKMSLWKFVFYTLLATIPWAVFFLYLGKQVGSNWQKIDEIAKPYLQPVIIAAIIVTVVYLLYGWIKKRKQK